MKLTCVRSMMTLPLILAGFSVCLPAQAQGTNTDEQELEKVLEMMKGQGMDPEQMQQMESLLRNMGEMEAQKKAAQRDKEQRAFEAETAGYGTAKVEVDGRQYELKVTACEVKDSRNGVFRIKARQSPGMDNGDLQIYSDGRHLQNSLAFSAGTAGAKYYGSQNTNFEFDGKALAWQGIVSSDDVEVPLSLSLRCGKEAVYYDKPSRDRPDTADNVLIFYLGDEAFKFETGLCSLREYRTGNLMVDFEATATGRFRGRPAIVLLTKSHPAEFEGSFHDFDLLLGELSAEQRKLSPFEVQKQLQDAVQSYRNEEIAAYQEKNNKDEWNSLPPDKMIEAMEASHEELSQAMDKADAMTYPEASSDGGAITIDGRDILFRGPAMQSNDADRAPELRNLAAVPEIFVTCGD